MIQGNPSALGPFFAHVAPYLRSIFSAAVAIALTQCQVIAEAADCRVLSRGNP